MARTIRTPRSSRDRPGAARIALSVLAALLLASTPALPAASAQTLRVRPVEILDVNGFERPMPVSRMLIPHDWRASGAVRWNPNSSCAGTAILPEWVAADPTGRYGLQIFPGGYWEANDLGPAYQLPGGCPKSTIATARDFLAAFVRRERPGAAIHGYRDRPDIERALAPLPPAPAAMPGQQIGLTRQVGDMVIGYAYQGRNHQELIRAVVTVNVTRISVMGMSHSTLTGVADPVIALRAPAGRLDPALLDFVQASARANPEWVARVTRMHANVQGNAIREAGRRADITARAGREINDIIISGERGRQAMLDRAHERWSLRMRDQTEWLTQRRDEVVTLPSHYDRAWRLNDGTYVVSNDPNFDPNVAWRIHGERLIQR